MSYPSATDPKFLATLEEWIRLQGEILVLIRYSHAAGSRDYELFSSFETLAQRLRTLPARTCATAFKQPQLRFRGIVYDGFITGCLIGIPDRTEFLVVETTPRTAGQTSWLHHATGQSHTQLREELESLDGQTVAAGIHPDWLKPSNDVISAVVPEADGSVTTGVY